MATREMQECSFKPKINPNTQSNKNIHEKLYKQGLARNKISKVETQVTLRPEEREACVSRLLTSHIRTEAKLQKTRMKSEACLDPDTQKPLFVPEIGREPQSPLDQPVWQRLYGKEEKSAEEEVDIYKVHRIASYKQIFQAATNDEVLTNEMIQDADLDPAVLRVLKKVLGKSLGPGVTFEKFVEIMENGVGYLNIQDRVTLLKRQTC